VDDGGRLGGEGSWSSICGGKPAGGVGGLGLNVWIASTFRLMGKTLTLSRKVRLASRLAAWRAFLTGISLTSLVNSLVASMTGPPSQPGPRR